MAGGARPRFRVPVGELVGEEITISGGEARHVRVMRLAPGDAVVLFDGAGREVEAEVTAVDAEAVRLRIGRALDRAAESALAITLVQALPVKLPRMDRVVRMATELGVAEIVPVLAARSQVPSGGEAVLERRGARWLRVAEAAAKQSSRNRCPLLRGVTRFADVPWDSLPEARFVLDAAAPAGLRSLLAAESPPAAVALVVGPEGGLADAELEGALEAGAIAASLGPRVLRADTAGPATVAVVQHVWGDLG